MFRGFRATAAPRGRIEYEFHWLLRRPIRATFDQGRGVLAFPALFPGIDARSAMIEGLDAIVRSRTSRREPAHKRLDARRARVSRLVRNRDWSLIVHVRGANHRYAVQRSLNLINELYLSLHESWPEYLIQRFGLSEE